MLTSDPKLERTIDKILNQTEVENLSSLKKSFKESLEILSKSQASLEQEYDRIIDEGKKEAQKIEKQIIGGSDLESEINKFCLSRILFKKFLRRL